MGADVEIHKSYKTQANETQANEMQADEMQTDGAQAIEQGR